MRWMGLFVLGALAATLGDRGHVAFGVLSYPDSVQPWWVFPEMGLAAVGLSWSWTRFPGSGGEGTLSLREALGPALWFLGAYGATSPLSQWPVLLTLGLLGLFCARAWHEKLSKTTLSYCVAVAIGGAGAEILISSAGLFAYTQPDWGLVPMWLPMLYLHVALATRAIGRALS